MASQPNFYIVRPGTIPHLTADGGVIHEPNIVPLIPADMLPQYIELEGVSRHLRFAQTAGMTNLGNMDAPEGQYRVRFNLSQSEDNNDEILKAANDSGAVPVTPESTLGCSEAEHDKDTERLQKVHEKSQNIHCAPKTVPRTGLASSRHNIDNQPPPPISQASSPPLKLREETDKATHPVESKPPQKKTYCTFWVRHGWCQYNRNCRYKHQMPTTMKGLKSVGLQGWPQWMHDYMQTERLPAPPPQVKTAVLPNSRSQSDMIEKAAKGRNDDIADKEPSASKRGGKKGANKDEPVEDLIDLL